MFIILFLKHDVVVLIIAKISVTSPIVIYMPTRELLAGERVLLFNVFNI